MSTLLPILLFILIGMGVGFSWKTAKKLLFTADRLALLSIYVLLFVLGAELGSNKELIARLAELGIKAFILALCCSAGSVLTILLASSFFPATKRISSDKPKTTHETSSPFTGTLKILACFILGIILGWQNVLPVWITQGFLVEYIMWVLVLAVGIGLGSELQAFAILKEMHLRVLLVPLLVILGTALGSIAGSFIIPGMSLKETLSVGAGFGYYSLSSLIIGKAGFQALASIALLANIFRELLGILTAPLLARYVGPLAPVAVAGATAMDTCLPAIARFSGEKYAIIAVFSGVSLTLIVPFLVAFILNF